MQFLLLQQYKRFTRGGYDSLWMRARIAGAGWIKQNAS
jgi:hypothetical protein